MFADCLALRPITSAQVDRTVGSGFRFLGCCIRILLIGSSCGLQRCSSRHARGCFVCVRGTLELRRSAASTTKKARWHIHGKGSVVLRRCRQSQTACVVAAPRTCRGTWLCCRNRLKAKRSHPGLTTSHVPVGLAGIGLRTADSQCARGGSCPSWESGEKTRGPHRVQNPGSLVK